MTSDGPRSVRRSRESVAEAWEEVPDPLGPLPPPARPPASRPKAASLTRAEVRVRRAVALGGCVSWAGAMTALWGLRNLGDGGQGVVGQAVALTAFIVVIFRAALAKGRNGLGISAPSVALLAVSAPLLFIAVTFPSFQPGIGPFARLVRCFGLGLLTVAPMLALTIWSARASFAAGATWRGAALGAACGLAASLVLTLHCEIAFGGHVALAHGLPVVLATVAGALFGKRVTRA